MKSLFVTGTGTDVGKTYVAAGLAATFRDMGIDIGVMKPFAAGTAQKSGFLSSDVKMLADAAGVDDPESLLNPQFFSISNPPNTVWTPLKTRPKIGRIISGFQRLSKIHDAVLVEGMGGIMTPIQKDYFVANLIKEMNIPALLVAGTGIGTINHTVMTVMACKRYGVQVRGIVLNDFEAGYRPDRLACDLGDLTGVPVLGVIPFIHSLKDSSVPDIFRKNLDLKSMQ